MKVHNARLLAALSLVSAASAAVVKKEAAVDEKDSEQVDFEEYLRIIGPFLGLFAGAIIGTLGCFFATLYCLTSRPMQRCCCCLSSTAEQQPNQEMQQQPAALEGREVPSEQRV